MTIENGAAEAANDTVVADPNAAAASAADTSQDEGEDQTPELDADGNPIVAADETEELEWDGKKWVLPKDVVASLKPALLRQADYTKKTQEVAEAKRAVEARETEFRGHGEREQALWEAKVKVAVLDNNIAQYDAAIQQAYNENDSNRASQLIWQRDQIKTQRETADRDLSQKDREHQDRANRETGERQDRVVAGIKQHLPEWIPGGELDLKLLAYGTSRGFTQQELGALATQAPKLVAELNRLRLYDEAAKKKVITQTFEKTQQAAPVTRVGGNSGSAARKTTDSSGDALSTEEWAKREAERTRKKA